MRSREFLLDVSRLIWRLWSGRLPTGIDRVCLEYVRHFGPRSQAVIQFRGHLLVLAPAASNRLFREILSSGPGLKRKLGTALSAAVLTAKWSPPRPGMIYLNVGHTGLERPQLRRWIEGNGLRAVFLVHDLIPITHPQFCRPGEAAKHQARMLTAIGSASGIIGNSQSTLDELADFAKGAALEMPPGLSAWIGGCRSAVEPCLPNLGRPYFVTVGTIEGRKNHILLLEVWKRLVATLGTEAPALVVVGQRGWEAQQVTEILDDLAELEGAVIERSRSSDRELQGLLGEARALLMPSLAEGFGLPIIEALQAGAPVIASDLKVYREIVGDIPTYLDPFDAKAWEAAIRDFIGNGRERKRQKSQMKSFTVPDWPSHFERLEKWLPNLPSRFGLDT